MARNASAPVLFTQNSRRVGFKDTITPALEKLEVELREHIIRSVAYAGADLMYKAMKMHVPVRTGETYGAIYHWFDKKRSTDWKKIYMIGPNKQKAFHWYNLEYGHYRYNKSIDFKWQKSKSNKNAKVSTPGTMDTSVHDIAKGRLPIPIWVPATPFIRETYSGNIDAALEAGKRRMREKMREVFVRDKQVDEVVS
jgi:hypothetical protein